MGPIGLVALENWVVGVIIESTQEKNSGLAIAARVMQVGMLVFTYLASYSVIPAVIGIPLVAGILINNGRGSGIVDLTFNKLFGGFIFSIFARNLFAGAVTSLGMLGAQCAVAAPAVLIGALAITSSVAWNYPARRRGQEQ